MLFRLLFVVTALSAMSLHLQAQTVTYVKPIASGTGDGSTWANATADLYTALQQAKTAASASTTQEVWVAQGTYTTLTGSTRTSDRDLSFEIGAFVQLLGGFDGTETNKLAASPQGNPTILTGDMDGDGQLPGNTYNVVFADNCGSSAGLAGFTVTGGFADKPAGFDARGRAGAGLYLFGENGRVANLIITDVQFVDNEAEGLGGGAYFKGSQSGQSSPIVERCSFQNNRAGLQAGAVFIDGSFGGTANAKFTEVDFSNNATVSLNGSGAGGAVYISGPANGTVNCDFKQCRFTGNETVVTQNAGFTGANGGAVYVTTIDNAAGNGTSTLNFDNCIIDNNTAYSAGGVYLNGATLANFRNCTVISNAAIGGGGSGAGIYINSSTADVVNHISYDNVVSADPSRGPDFRFVNGHLTLSYAIVNAADSSALYSRASTANNDSYTPGAALQYATDPQLSSIAGYPQIGGATSPAVDAGNSGAIPPSGVDYTGDNRVFGSAVDLGAVESKFVPLPVELISFVATAEESQVILDWASASEVNLAGYRLMRSSDGNTFNEVSFVPAMDLGQYRYTDRAVADGKTYYYQLISTDLDGTTYESGVVTATLEDSTVDTLLTRLYPNPTAGELTVEITADVNVRTVYVSVLDLQGRKLRFWPLTKDGSHRLDLTDLPNGQYVVRLDAGERSQSEQFTVKH